MCFLMYVSSQSRSPNRNFDMIFELNIWEVREPVDNLICALAYEAQTRSVHPGICKDCIPQAVSLSALAPLKMQV